MQSQQSPAIKLNVSLDDVNLMLASLAKQPYEAVFQTVEKVRTQAAEQVNSSLSASTAEETIEA